MAYAFDYIGKRLAAVSTEERQMEGKPIVSRWFRPALVALSCE
jgi:hypothetical protein